MPPRTLSPPLPLNGLTLNEQKTTALLCLCTPEAGLGKAPHSPSQAHTQEPCNEVTKKKITKKSYVLDMFMILGCAGFIAILGRLLLMGATGWTHLV